MVENNQDSCRMHKEGGFIMKMFRKDSEYYVISDAEGKELTKLLNAIEKEGFEGKAVEEHHYEDSDKIKFIVLVQEKG